MKYKILSAGDPTTYVLVFESGDDVVEKLKTFANEHKLKASRFTAVGAFSEAMLGYYDYAIKDYKKISVNEQVEVLSFQGDVAFMVMNRRCMFMWYWAEKPAKHLAVIC